MDPIFEEAAKHLKDPNQPIEACSVNIKDLKLLPFLSNYVTSDLVSTKSFKEVGERVNLFYSKLSRLGLFKDAKVKLKAGDRENSLLYKIGLKRKSAYFASASQYIDPYNGAVVNVKAGYRNLFGLAEKLTVEYDKALYESKKTTYNLLIDLPTLPLGRRLFSLTSGYIYGITPLDRNIEQRTESRFLRLLNEKGTSFFTVEHVLRTNTLNNNRCSAEYLEKEVVPNRKFSLKLQQTHKNTFQMKNNKHRGELLNSSVELALPLFGDVHFIKTEVKQRKVFKLRPIKKIWKRAYRFMRLEENFSAGVLRSYYKNEELRINDKFLLHNSRGFLELGDRFPQFERGAAQSQSASNTSSTSRLWEENRMGDHAGTSFYIKNSYKLNIYDYPYLKKGLVHPFLHFSGYYLQGPTSKKGESVFARLRSEVRASSGIGFAFEIGSGVRIELLYNFFHLKQAQDREARFQFKVSMDD